MPSLIESRRTASVELSLIRQVMQSARADAINLALGELGFPMPEVLRDHALKLLADSTPVYTPNAGLPELRAAIASHYPATSENQVCVCNGVEEATFVTLLALLDRGDLLAIPDPEYPAYEAIGKILETDVIRLPYASDLSTIDRNLWENILKQHVKVLLLSHPSNPCGHIFTPEEATWLAALCDRLGITLIVDEIYSRLCFGVEPPQFSGKLQSLILLGGLSKSHCLSGWRIGWAVMPSELSAAVIKARQYVSTCSPWLSQKLAVFALSPQGLQAVQEVRAQLLACRAVVQSELALAGDRMILPQATPYVMLRIEGNCLETATRLADKGVIVVPGSAFGAQTRKTLRLNYAVPLPKLHQALDIITHELHFN